MFLSGETPQPATLPPQALWGQMVSHRMEHGKSWCSHLLPPTPHGWPIYWVPGTGLSPDSLHNLLSLVTARVPWTQPAWWEGGSLRLGWAWLPNYGGHKMVTQIFMGLRISWDLVCKDWFWVQLGQEICFLGLGLCWPWSLRKQEQTTIFFCHLVWRV